MPYTLEGRHLSPDIAFVHEGVQYPAGWLRNVNEEAKAAIGISWQPDEPVVYDQRYWWGYDEEGQLIPKDLEQLKQNWVGTVKQSAASQLAQTDWYITRAQDPSSAREIPEQVLEERGLIRSKSDEKELAILSSMDVAELAEYTTSQEFYNWTAMPVEDPDASQELELELELELEE